MKRISIEIFCGIHNKKSMYSDNKTLVCLYSVFAFFFGVVATLLDYYKTHIHILLFFAGLFLLSVFVFAIWLLKSKQKISYKSYFVYQGTVTLAMSLIWLFLSISNIYTKQLGFSMFYILGIIFGITFSLIFFVLRYLKWQKIKYGKQKEYYKEVNIKIISISVILLLLCSTLLKNIEKIILYKLLTSALFVLYFIFITIAFNMFVNYYIVKKYLQ